MQIRCVHVVRCGQGGQKEGLPVVGMCQKVKLDPAVFERQASGQLIWIVKLKEPRHPFRPHVSGWRGFFSFHREPIW